MIDEGWGQIPVVSEANGHRLIGIVTRTDLLRALLHKPRPESAENIPARLQRALGQTVWHTLRQVGALAATMQMPIYLVGGPVRDLLLKKAVLDLDIVVEGSAIDLVETVVTRLGGKLHTHARFGTAKWLPDPAALPLQPDDPPLPRHLDFVSARTEFYTAPTALPTVSQGSIKRDLIRRDFTINTLAVRLDGAHAGELIDHYGGLRDLENGLIRVLHSLSFVDDPTRILRAVRFEQRLGFVIEARTLALLRESAELVRRVTGPRIRHELELILAEPNATAMLARLAQLDVLGHLHPELVWNEEMATAFGNLAGLSADSLWHPLLAATDPTLVRFLLWMGTHPPAVQDGVTRHLHTRADTRENIALFHRLLHHLATLPPDSPPATLAAAIRPTAAQPAALLAARAWLHATPAATWLDSWQRQWQHVRTHTTGHHLRARGLTPGPRYTPILDALLAARLNGTVQTNAEEEALLEHLLRDG
jgi:tRNA nucleotidyltransferase (CCA-adding enzyme)